MRGHRASGTHSATWYVEVAMKPKYENHSAKPSVFASPKNNGSLPRRLPCLTIWLQMLERDEATHQEFLAVTSGSQMDSYNKGEKT